MPRTTADRYAECHFQGFGMVDWQTASPRSGPVRTGQYSPDERTRQAARPGKPPQPPKTGSFADESV